MGSRYNSLLTHSASLRHHFFRNVASANPIFPYYPIWQVWRKSKNAGLMPIKEDAAEKALGDITRNPFRFRRGPLDPMRARFGRTRPERCRRDSAQPLL